MKKYVAAAGVIFPLVWQAGVVFSQGAGGANAGGAAVVKAQETKGTADQRADQIVKQLTQEEKISLLSGTANGFVTHAVERLGIPGFTMADGPNGVRNAPGNQPGIAYPSGAALAATWDPEMAKAYGHSMGVDDRTRGVNFQLGPGLNICRVPVNGRNFEYFGEDPFLAGVMAANWVKACSEQGSVPTIKHFAANNQETNRNSVNAVVDERVMHEIYLPAFKKAAQEGGVSAFMCSYNRLNGSYTSNNDWLLNEVLKKEWGYPGLVMSDWGASHDVTDIAKGLDLEMPSGQNLNAAKLQPALAAGTVKMADVDGAVHRFLRTAFAQGWLDAGWQQKISSLPLDSADSAKAALDIAQASIVLLKNEGGALPLDRAKVKRIVVLGPNARAADLVAQDDPSGKPIGVALPINIGGGGSGAVTPLPNRMAEADYFRGIAKIAGENVKVEYIPMPGEQVSIAQAPGGRGGRGGGAGRGRGGVAEDPAIYETLAMAKTSAAGEAGLTLTVEVAGGQTLPVTVQKGVNATWMAGQLPFDVPAGKDAKFTWKGVLMAGEEGDFELHVAGTPAVTVGGKAVAGGSLVHLQKGQATPIEIVADAVATPPAGRGGRGGGGGRGGAGGGMPQIRVALTVPVVPDLSSLKTADAVIVCIGLNSVVEQEGRDRPFELPAAQQYLVKRAAAMNPHTIVVTNAGAAVGMTAWRDAPAAIVHAWYLGQEGGLALGKMLFGDADASGRLCSTFDKTWEENPAYAYYPGQAQAGVNYTVEPYTEGLFYGYRGYDKAGKEPLFPFGYGLSYTTFELGNMKVEKSGTDMKVSIDVKNTGKRTGAEVVEIYVGEQGAPVPRPVRELKGFSKVMVEAGATKRVEVVLGHEAFAYWSPEKKGWVVDAGGKFTIEAGVSERDIKAKEMVQVQ